MEVLREPLLACANSPVNKNNEVELTKLPTKKGERDIKSPPPSPPDGRTRARTATSPSRRVARKKQNLCLNACLGCCGGLVALILLLYLSLFYHYLHGVRSLYQKVLILDPAERRRLYENGKREIFFNSRAKSKTKEQDKLMLSPSFLVSQMTNDEKRSMLHGIPAFGLYSGIVPGVPRLGIPPLITNDGPQVK
ncbi:unnamed protein product, partial [Amoebophrya sp. A25]|eukprot:GSA25T00017197001.1